MTNKTKAYTVKVIAKKLNRCQSVVFGHMRTLKKQKKIQVDSPYYMWK